MNTLARFRAALLDAGSPVPAALVDGSGSPAGRRYAVYRNNVAVSLRDALRVGFPVLLKLIGAQNFDALAGLFLRAHPPASPLMMHYGTQMPAFLESFAPLQHIGYLPDVTRLELAIRQSYHAADAPPFDAARLGALSPDALNDAILHLAPSVQVITSQWPLFDIWRFNMVEGAAKPAAQAQCTLVARPEFDPHPHAITHADAAWVTATQDGASFGAAQNAALHHDASYDLTPLLTLLIQTNALTDLTTKD